MATMHYRLGDISRLGYIPDPNPDGTPVSLDGYGLRMRIDTIAGYVTIPGTVMQDQVAMIDGQQRTVDVASFEISPLVLDVPPRLYRIAVEFDDSTADGWREFADSEDHYLNVEKF